MTSRDVYFEALRTGKTQSQAAAAAGYFSAHGMTREESAARAAAQPSGWTGVGDAIGVLFSTAAGFLQLDAQKKKQELQAQLAKQQIAAGTTGISGQQYGGLNIMTLIAFAGVGILAILLLKKSF